MRLRQFYVYIMTNKYNDVLYIGVTRDLLKRVFEHKEARVKGFTKQYNVHKLVYYEPCDTAEQAIAREKQLKNWHRQWKMNLIKDDNPEFKDLYREIVGDPETSSG